MKKNVKDIPHKKYRRVELLTPAAELTCVVKKDGKQWQPVRPGSSPEVSAQRLMTLGRPIPFKKKVLRCLPFQDACAALWNFPFCMEHPEEAAAVQLLILLSQVAPLLVGEIPAMPVLMLATPPQAAESLLRPLLRAIQGPETWEGPNWHLSRHWVLSPRLSLLETAPSHALSDYLGGKFRDEFGKTRRFCFPYIGSAALLMPELPQDVTSSVINLSPLALFLTFSPLKCKENNRPLLKFSSNCFGAYRPEGLQSLIEHEDACFAQILAFLIWFYQKEKRLRQWREQRDRFRPVVRCDGFTRPVSDERTELLCAALALFHQYLLFVSERMQWISQEMASDLLNRYWQAVLPHSAPTASAPQSPVQGLSYTDPEVFWKFLTEHFLPQYRMQIRRAPRGTAETMGLLYAPDDVEEFITPRGVFLQTYSAWLQAQQIPAPKLTGKNPEAAVQRQLQEAQIPLRGEKGNASTWRFSFYQTNAAPNGKSKIDCFALPLPSMPEPVRQVFESMFGSEGTQSPVPNSSEPVPNSPKEVKAP